MYSYQNNHSTHPAIHPQDSHYIPYDDHDIIIGVDEVGRGCLFGHMTVAAVILPAQLSLLLDETTKSVFDHTQLAALTDSKKLSEKKRSQLSDHIKKIASYSIIDVPATVIDDINIHQATLLGMKSAIQALLTAHTPKPSHTHIYIDGSHRPDLDSDFTTFYKRQTTWIKGDSRHAAMACASIIAKVHRDAQMNAYAHTYPNYAIDKHKGYATKAHLAALATYGALPEHRKSFAPVRAILSECSHTP